MLGEYVSKMVFRWIRKEFAHTFELCQCSEHMACSYIPDANISLLGSGNEVVAFVDNSHGCYWTFMVSGVPAISWECHRNISELLREELVGA